MPDLIAMDAKTGPPISKSLSDSLISLWMFLGLNSPFNTVFSVVTFDSVVEKTILFAALHNLANLLMPSLSLLSGSVSQIAIVSYILRPNKNVPTFDKLSFILSRICSLGLLQSILPFLSAAKPSREVVIEYINLPINLIVT